MAPIIPLLALLLLVVAFHAQSQSLRLMLEPGATFPLGPTGPAGERIFDFGGGAAVVAELTLPRTTWLYPRVTIGYDALMTSADDVLSLVSAGIGAEFLLAPTPFLNLGVETTGGYGLAVYHGLPGSYPFAAGGIRARFILSPLLSLGLAARYRHYFPLYQAVNVSMGIGFSMDAIRRRPNLQVIDLGFQPVFPVFFRYYEDHPLGTLRVRNREGRAIQEVTTSVFVKQFMDTPKSFPAVAELRRDEELEVDLFGLFTDSILRVTEGTTVAAEVTVQYRIAGDERTVTASGSLPVLYRNAMTWDDDRKAASFITSKDPMVMKYAKSIAGMVREMGGVVGNLFFRQALGLFESLTPYGLRYVIDPKSSYTELSRIGTSLDYLQFPVQTLNYKGGDCDDLSILYAALLESIGVATAFVTVPGHIFLAFALDVPPTEATGRLLLPADDLIAIAGNTWVPVEITMIQEGFLRAWKEGAREWRQAYADKSAKFLPVREAWLQYQPTGMIAEDTVVVVPDISVVAPRYTVALNAYAETELRSRGKMLTDEMARSSETPKVLNKLGALYAQFGKLKEAEVQFSKAAASDYPPALVNLGTLAFLGKDMARALGFYERARAKDPGNVAALAGIAKANFELENYGVAREAYAELQKRSPDMAGQLSYIFEKVGGEERAYDAMMRDLVYWSEQ